MMDNAKSVDNNANPRSLLVFRSACNVHPYLLASILGAYLIPLLAIKMPITVWAFSFTLGLFCIAVTLIDLKFLIIPNFLNGLLAVTGCLFWLTWDSDQLGYHTLSGLITSLTFYLFSISGFYLFGKEILGLGDVKFIGSITIWVGISAIPFFILTAAVLGILTFVFRRSIQHLGVGNVLPFGPALAISGFFSWVFGSLA